MESSRLSKLFDLLSASSCVLREQAAQQIAEIVRDHSNEAGPLLAKLRLTLRHVQWETRYAAAEAVGAIASACIAPSVDDRRQAQVGQIQWKVQFDLSTVLASNVVLAASEGSEYENVKVDTSTQKRRIKEHFGGGALADASLKVDEFLTDEDLDAATQVTSDTSHMTGTTSHVTDDVGPPNKVSKLELDDETLETLEQNLLDCKNAEGAQVLFWFYRILLEDLTDPTWTTRHGAALALRQMQMHLCKGDANFLHKVFETTPQLFYVSAVDRFNDFVGTQVVAPVRESVAQTIGSLFTFLPKEGKEALIEVTSSFLTDPHSKPWQCVHAGLLIVKYCLPFILQLQIDNSKPLNSVDRLLQLLCSCVLMPNEEIIVAASQAISPNLAKVGECATDTLLNGIWTILLSGRFDVLDEWLRGLLHMASELRSVYGVLSKFTSEHVCAIYPFLDNPSVDVCRPAVLILTTAAANPTNFSEQTALHVLRMCVYRAATSRDDDLSSSIEQLWRVLIAHRAFVLAACPFFGQWLAALMVSDVYPLIDASLLGFDNREIFLGGAEAMAAVERERVTLVVKTKIKVARMLAYLAIELYEMKSNEHRNDDGESWASSLESCLLFHLASSSGTRKTVVCILLVEWSKIGNGRHRFPFHFSDLILANLSDDSPTKCEELLPKFTELNSICRDFVYGHSTVDDQVKMEFASSVVTTLKDAFDFCRRFMINGQTSNVNAEALTLKKDLQTKIAEIRQTTHRLSCWLCCVLIRFDLLPEKLNPVIIPLMEIIKYESNMSIVVEAADVLAMLIVKTVARVPSPSAKIVKNLISLHCADETKTPQIKNEQPGQCYVFNGEKRFGSFESGESGGRNRRKATTASVDEIVADSCVDASTAASNAGATLKRLCSASDSVTSIPSFWSTLNNTSDEESQDLINSLQLFETVYPSLPLDLCGNLIQTSKEKLLRLVRSKFAGIRYITARCIAVLASADLLFVVNELLPTILRLISDPSDDCARIGATEIVFDLVEEFKLNVVGIASILALPMLARMADTNPCVSMKKSRLALDAFVDVSLTNASDSDEVFRFHSDLLDGKFEENSALVTQNSMSLVSLLNSWMESQLFSVEDFDILFQGLRKCSLFVQMASRCFGSLVKLLPLEVNKAEFPGLSDEMRFMLNEQRQFLHLLAQPDKLAQTELPSAATKADLRYYQKDGVTWLMFLNKYNLHGILCDDMGLGKTLQTLCCLAATENKEVPPSLIVCPKTLVHHWVQETGRFFDGNVLRAANIDACPNVALFMERKLLDKCNLFVTSYEFVRKEVRAFEQQKWRYCILDEGHVIKNPKTLTTKAVMQLKADYRLVLSGTPVQNNVLELWSLFEFLIPGYLGDRRQFHQRFGKPILAAREAKASTSDTEAGREALETLHKMVLPFILRRRKSDVLHELPPKIVQDYYCALSPLQRKLYEDFSQNALTRLISDSEGSNRNAFQILTYLRKLCDHPCLVLKPEHFAYQEIMDNLKETYGCEKLEDFSLSGKIVALRQLLIECGITRSNEDDEDDSLVPTVSAHRALIFCQFKTVVDLIANCFDDEVFGQLSYLRLDGTIPPSERQGIADKFNADPTIDALLLTTHIGGLGLNLTGADVVIFVDHDWNPAKDLQAMDRAHRIGQKRTVNVYRLVTENTLEEKIMRFQLFKSQNADAIIGEQNRSLASMATEQLLDLLAMDKNGSSSSEAAKKGNADAKMRRKKKDATSTSEAHLDLPSLWDQSQYEDAFDVQKFFESMR